MYVCIYVCMYCKQVAMYLCMYIMYCKYVCMLQCIYVCTYVPIIIVTYKIIITVYIITYESLHFLVCSNKKNYNSEELKISMKHCLSSTVKKGEIIVLYFHFHFLKDDFQNPQWYFQ